jgi:hypothetical protein
MYEHVRTRGMQPPNDRRPDAAGAAGDQNHLALQGLRFGPVGFKRSLHGKRRYRNDRAA